MPTHDALNDRLSEYLDDELDAAERAAVEAHLAECGECRADLEALAAVVARAPGAAGHAAGAESLARRRSADRAAAGAPPDVCQTAVRVHRCRSSSPRASR